MRVLEGLEGASNDAHSRFDHGEMEKILAGLGNRTFLLNNVRESGPQLFQTRWTLCYLRGPMTRDQIRTLMAAKRSPEAVPEQEKASPSKQAHANTAPVLPPNIPQYFIPATAVGTCAYKPALVGAAKLHYLDDKQKLDESRDVLMLVPITNGAAAVDWTQAKALALGLDELEKEPADGAQFEDLPEAAAKAKNYAIWNKAFVTWLFQTQTLDLFESAALDERSKPGETERDFRIRLQQIAREQRDRMAEALRQKYAPKMAALEERKRRAELAAEQQKAQRNQSMIQAAVGVGAGLLSAFMGRKAISVSNMNRAATAARQAGRSWKEAQDVAQATENVEQIAQQAAELEKQFEAELADRESKIDPATEQFNTVSVRLKKANIEVKLVALAWSPQ